MRILGIVLGGLLLIQPCFSALIPWQPYRMASGLGPQEHPRVSGTIVVWQEFNKKRGDYDVVVADANLPKDRIWLSIDDVNDQIHPVIWESKVVWQEFSVRRKSQDWDIFMLDLDGDAEGVIQIYPVSTSPGIDEQVPAVHGNIVVWEDSVTGQSDVDNRNGNWDIYARNIHTGLEVRVTKDSHDQISPAISGDLVVWQDGRHGEWAIYALWMDGLITTTLQSAFAENKIE